MRALVLAAIWLPLVAHAAPPVPEYDPQPVVTSAHAETGWGMFATMHGRTLDLTDRDGWADDPRVNSGDVEAGYGWRKGRAAAMIGYNQPDLGPGHGSTFQPHAGDPGVLGLGLVLHTR
jgi:hypothetical protein